MNFKPNTKMMLVMFAAAAFAVVLAGCTFTAFPGEVQPNAAPTALNSPAISEPTPTPYDGACTFLWVSQTLPELSARLDRVFREAGMPEATAAISAYGESCLAFGTDEVVRFTPMQFNFLIDVAVADANDAFDLGEKILSVLTVIENFAVDDYPDIRRGEIEMQFQDDRQVIMVSFKHTRARELVIQGLRGSALFNALNRAE
jgi:hypothetical protein